MALPSIRLIKLHELLNIPLIASGGAGNMGHFIDAFVLGKADAALAASIFHFGEIKIPDAEIILKRKEYSYPLKIFPMNTLNNRFCKTQWPCSLRYSGCKDTARADARIYERRSLSKNTSGKESDLLQSQ